MYTLAAKQNIYEVSRFLLDESELLSLTVSSSTEAALLGVSPRQRFHFFWANQEVVTSDAADAEHKKLALPK